MVDFAQARQVMVDCQVRPSDVTRYAIIEAMLDVPRELFVPRALRDVAYAESDISLAANRCVLAPRTLAKMLEAASVGSDDLVLDLAPGLGYSSAILSHLAVAVIAVEPDAGMAKQAAEAMDRLECDNVIVTHGAPAEGNAEHGPYDVILINGAIAEVPEALSAQLKEGGRLVAIFADGPVGQCRVAVRTANGLSARTAFDATAPLLDGFAKGLTFVF